MEVDGARKGTFELWHRTSREHPIAGSIETRQRTGSTTTFEVIFGALDTPYLPVPLAGVTLADCLSALPLLAEHVGLAGLPVHFVRGKLERKVQLGDEWSADTHVTFHPSVHGEGLIEQMRIEPRNVPQVDIREIAQGFHVHIRNNWVDGHVSMPTPPASMVSPEEWRMWTNSPTLNEFGYFYVALFLAGNYARYFPDRWLLDVERSSPLALAIEELCTITEWRVPWLSLCELGRNLLVHEP